MEATSAGYPGSVPASRDRTIAIVAALALLICMPIGWLSGDTSTGQVVGVVVVVIVCLAILAGLMRWLVPRARAAGREARTGLILGIVALVVCVVFWTGLPLAVGPAAVALGLGARAHAGADKRAAAAIGLGAFAMAATFIAMLVG